MDIVDQEAAPEEVASKHSTKKVRLFSAKEFRSKLNTSEKQSALQQFADICNSNQDHNYVIEYLETGGNCLELFHLLETGSEVPPSLVLEVVNQILLQIVSNYAQYQASANEACSYFLNSHIALVNKMLSLGATGRERKIVLKLLTTIVTFSKKLAKEILLHVNFNPTNLQVLSKQTGEKESVRNAFIHFLMAFLVEGEYPTISILLEKKGLLPSIINGLQYDSADTVCMVMVTLKTHILENSFVSKTQKMSTFSTPIVKDIVNLYNWKGPENFNPKKKLQTPVIDEYDKARVNESVHDLLLILCTSHKFGVIFRDRQLGLSKKPHNSLMYTVLDSLERPWEHSYAGELVTKTCGACPDLVKTMWLNLKTFLEPRATTRWLKAVQYAVALVKALEPAAIDFCARDLNAYQLVQVIQFLIAPTPILSLIIPEDYTYDKPSVKHHALLLLAEFLRSIQKYASAAKSWLKAEDLQILKNLLSEHVSRHFPPVQSLLKDWAKPDDENYSVLEHLEVIFEVLDLYQGTCPQMLDSLNSVELPSFLKEIGELPDERTACLQARAVKLFISFEPSLFLPGAELFGEALPLILEFYFETRDASAKATLELLLKNTGIFDGCTDEIQVWINAVFDLNLLDGSISQILVEIIRETSEHILEYLLEMPKFTKNVELHVEQRNFKDILENLSVDSLPSSGVVSLKQRGLSPLLLGALKHLQGIEQTKSVKSYFSSVIINLLHFQTTASLVFAIISSEKYQGAVSKSISNYVSGWASNENTVLLKTKARLVQNFSSSFLEGDISDFFTENQEEINSRPGQIQNCFNQAIFYFTNSANPTEMHLDNCRKVFEFAAAKQEHEELAGIVFGNPILLQQFSPLHQGVATEFLMEVVKEFKGVNFGLYLRPFKEKLVTCLRKILKKTGKKSVNYGRLLEILEAFSLEHQQCVDVLTFLSRLSITSSDCDFKTFYCSLLVYTLRGIMRQNDSLEPLDEEIMQAIAQTLTILNRNLEQFDASACASAFKDYLEIFPHSVALIQAELFDSIVGKQEFCKESALLAKFLLKKRPDFVETFVKNLSNITSKKGLILPLLQALIMLETKDEILESAYKNFEPSILKGLQKPQKASQYFEMYQDVLTALISKFMPVETCQPYVDKVHKFETSETFHVEMLTSVFSKIVLDNPVERQLNNCVITLVLTVNFLFKKKEKLEEDWAKLMKIIESIDKFLSKIAKNENARKTSFRVVCKNDHFQLFCKFCLKFGLSGQVPLLKVLNTLVQFVNFEEGEVQVLLEMAGSHSEFLDLMLGNDSECKTEMLKLVLLLCQRWPVLMQRNHVPVLLSAYHATVSPGDRIILTLLQMYEKAANKTNFYDFKPFLWGSAATSHYSVRQDIQKALWRQPKISDILEILQEHWVVNTITTYPLDSGLIAADSQIFNPQQNVYDLAFCLPLFSSLLAPENEVTTSKFIKTGALSLTVVALSSNDKDIRLAACHVLARLHYHLEAGRGMKDKLLWVRFVEAICRGTAVIEEFKLNNFAAIFWARMALVLTQPLKPLYVSLSQYLSARVAPNLKAIPELYTFLHNSDVNFKETRTFILEILHDGLRTDNDFSVALHAMAFKLIMKLFSSVADVDAKKQCLMVIERACRLSSGRKLLCSSYGLLSWLHEIANNVCCGEEVILLAVVQILAVIAKHLSSSKFVDCNLINLILASVIDKGLVSNLRKDALDCFLQLVLEMCKVDCKFLTEERLMVLIIITNSKKCRYLLKFGCKFFDISENVDETESLMQSIVTKWINK